MSVLIPCDNCGVEYVLPSEVGVRRVTGSVVTARCRQCNSRIVAEGLELVLEYALEQPSRRPGLDAARGQLANASAPAPTVHPTLPVGSPNASSTELELPNSSASYEPVSSVEVVNPGPPPPPAMRANRAPQREIDEPSTAAVESTAVAESTAQAGVSQGEYDRPNGDASDDDATRPSATTADSFDGDRHTPVMGSEPSPRPNGAARSDEARGRSLPAAPRARRAVPFTGALPPDDSATEIEPAPPSSGTPDLASLKRRHDSDSAEAQGPDSAVARLINLTALPAVALSTAPVALDPPAVPESVVADERESDSTSEARPTEPKAESNAGGKAVWLLGLLAIVLFAGLMIQIGKSNEAAEDEVLAPARAAEPASAATVALTVPSAAAVATEAAPTATLPLDPKPTPATPPAAALAAVPKKASTKSIAPASPAPVEPETAPAAPPASAAPAAAPAEAAPAPADLPPIDQAALRSALAAAAEQASSCRKDGDPVGTATAVVTFAPSGRVTSALVQGPPFAGTATGGCIAASLRRAKVPAFSGGHVTVSKTIQIR
jgi:hypothetical protein